MISVIIFFIFEALLEFLRLFTPLIFNLWLYHVILHVVRFWLTQSLNNEVSKPFFADSWKVNQDLSFTGCSYFSYCRCYKGEVIKHLLGSSIKDIFEQRMSTGSGHFAINLGKRFCTNFRANNLNTNKDT